MNHVEESVLIPKDEYETLIEKVSEINDKKNVEDVNLDKFDDSNKNRIVSDLPIASQMCTDVNSEIVTNSENSPRKSGEAAASPEVKKKPGTNSSPSTVKAAGPPIDNGLKQIDNDNGPAAPAADDDTSTVSTTTTKDNVNGVGNTSLKINMLLDNVSQKYKQPVKVMAEFISENGKGIIAWDESLKFVYFNDTIPRTNLAKMLTYLIEKSDVRPKGITLLLKSLKIIGIEHPKAWARRQAAKFAQQGVKKKANTSEVETNDSPDGIEVETKKKIPAKEIRFQKLSGKWQSW